MSIKPLPGTRQQDALAELANSGNRASGSLLPGALLMAMSAKLLSPLMFINLGFPTFL
jgi:hypothetical protein